MTVEIHQPDLFKILCHMCEGPGIGYSSQQVDFWVQGKLRRTRMEDLAFEWSPEGIIKFGLHRDGKRLSRVPAV